jgi:hypothetical protein
MSLRPAEEHFLQSGWRFLSYLHSLQIEPDPPLSESAALGPGYQNYSVDPVMTFALDEDGRLRQILS